MPELPEVQTTVASLGDLSGLRLLSFDFLWPRQIEPDCSTFADNFCGAVISGTGRRGKFICLYTDKGTIAIHLRMSGKIAVVAGDTPLTKHTRVVAHLDDGRKIRFDDARKFGRWKMVPAGEDVPGVGMEPLDPACTAEWIKGGCEKVRKPIKSWLLDQSFICGLGNIYTDEVCFAAGIHPLRPAKDLTLEECAGIQQAMVSILTKAIALKGTSFDWAYDGGSMQNHIQAYGRGGEPCKKCGTVMETVRVNGRNAVFCPHCQK